MMGFDGRDLSAVEWEPIEYRIKGEGKGKRIVRINPQCKCSVRKKMQFKKEKVIRDGQPGGSRD